MKTTLSGYLSGLWGKLGSCAAQMRRSGSSLSKKSIPYSITGLPRSTAQQAQNAKYSLALAGWQALSAEEKAEYNTLGAALQISGWNYYLMVYAPPTGEARYDTAKYDTDKYS